MANLVEFFNKNNSLKGEVLLEDPKHKRFCLTIVKIAPDTKHAVRTNQFYLGLGEGRVLFQDFISGTFWTDDRRYPNGQFRRIKSSTRYRDIIVSRDEDGVLFSIIDGAREHVLRFRLDAFQAAELGDTMCDYLDKRRIAWALSQPLVSFVDTFKEKLFK